MIILKNYLEKIMIVIDGVKIPLKALENQTLVSVLTILLKIKRTSKSIIKSLSKN